MKTFKLRVQKKKENVLSSRLRHVKAQFSSQTDLLVVN